jgi:hypothetical protein
MAQVTKTGRPLSKNTRVAAFAAFDKALVDPDHGESRTELALRLGVTRQRIHTLHAEWVETIDGGKERITAMLAAQDKAARALRSKRAKRLLKVADQKSSAPADNQPALTTTPENDLALDLYLDRDLAARPFTREESMTVIERAIRYGVDRASAYKIAMVNRATADGWVARNFEGFGDHVRRAESLVVTGIASNLMRIALSNRPDAGTIGLRLLAIKEPDAWSEKQRIQIESDVFIHDVSRLMTSPESVFLASQLGASMLAGEAVIENPPQPPELPAHDEMEAPAKSEVEAK